MYVPIARYPEVWKEFMTDGPIVTLGAIGMHMDFAMQREGTGTPLHPQFDQI
jgi:hypothetical protein